MIDGYEHTLLDSFPMKYQNITAIVLAAGLSTRMKSDTVKVLHYLCGWPLVYYPLEALYDAGVRDFVVVGSRKDNEVARCIRHRFRHVRCATQKKPLGTADAVKAALPQLSKRAQTVLIINGDAALLSRTTIQNLIQFHREKKGDVSLISAHFDCPPPYGRIIRGDHHQILKIIEEQDATLLELKIHEVNAGFYCVEKVFLKRALSKIKKTNAKKEFYLTDIVAETPNAFALKIENNFEILGVNHRLDLDQTRALIQARINEKHMLHGVTLVDSSSIYIDQGVSIDSDVTIYPNTTIRGKTSIGSKTIIESHCLIENSIIHGDSHIKQGSVIEKSIVGEETTVGPMAHLRPLTHLKKGAHVGNFVELKKTVLGAGSKVNHLTYLGDATIGSNVNVGCGVITCNYDGVKKHETIIANDAFIGSDCQLVAPIKIGKGAYVGSGSTVTKNVPAHSLAIARSKQVNLMNYVSPIMKKKGKKK